MLSVFWVMRRPLLTALLIKPWLCRSSDKPGRSLLDARPASAKARTHKTIVGSKWGQLLRNFRGIKGSDAFPQAKPKPDRIRALELLADGPQEGCTEGDVGI
jgi:hypothetical protein